MGRKATWFGAGSIVAAPLLIGLGDQIRMAGVDRSESAGMVDTEYGPEQAAQYLEQATANPGALLAAGALTYAGALLLIPSLVTIWRVSVARSPRWAWTGAVMATLAVLGHMVHLQGAVATNLALGPFVDQPWVGDLLFALEREPFGFALFLPFLVGWLCFVPQAVGLRRAGAIPRWAMASVIVGTLVFVVIGSTPWSTGLWMIAMIAGLSPAAMALMRADFPTPSETPDRPRIPAS